MESWIMTLSALELGAMVFFTQLVFIFARTMNVIYVAEHNQWGSQSTGALVHLSWLLSIAIGVKSVMYLDWVVILFSMSGGLLGTYLGIKLKKYLQNRKK